MVRAWLAHRRLALKNALRFKSNRITIEIPDQYSDIDSPKIRNYLRLQARIEMEDLLDNQFEPNSKLDHLDFSNFPLFKFQDGSEHFAVQLIHGSRLFSKRKDQKLIPGAVITEIGRQRAETFALENEGDGRPFDVDQFDATYFHMILLQLDKKEIVGAYRAAHVRTLIAPRTGKKMDLRRLYTYDEYDYNAKILRPHLLGGSFELGRSYVIREYQQARSQEGGQRTSTKPLITRLFEGLGYLLSHPAFLDVVGFFGAVSFSLQDFGKQNFALLSAVSEAVIGHPTIIAQNVRARNLDPEFEAYFQEAKKLAKRYLAFMSSQTEATLKAHQIRLSNAQSHFYYFLAYQQLCISGISPTDTETLLKGLASLAAEYTNQIQIPPLFGLYQILGCTIGVPVIDPIFNSADLLVVFSRKNRTPMVVRTILGKELTSRFDLGSSMEFVTDGQSRLSALAEKLRFSGKNSIEFQEEKVRLKIDLNEKPSRATESAI